jgi:hypothetical protein
VAGDICFNCCCEAQDPGTECCPGPCPEQGAICCLPDLCCGRNSDDEIVCCEEGEKCCDDTGEYYCCLEDETCCEGECCAEDIVCCDGVCCDEGECCNDGACEPCGCESDEDCPEGQCCEDGECVPCGCEDVGSGACCRAPITTSAGGLFETREEAEEFAALVNGDPFFQGENTFQCATVFPEDADDPDGFWVTDVAFFLELDDPNTWECIDDTPCADCPPPLCGASGAAEGVIYRFFESAACADVQCVPDDPP